MIADRYLISLSVLSYGLSDNNSAAPHSFPLSSLYRIERAEDDLQAYHPSIMQLQKCSNQMSQIIKTKVFHHKCNVIESFHSKFICMKQVSFLQDNT